MAILDALSNIPVYPEDIFAIGRRTLCALPVKKNLGWFAVLYAVQTNPCKKLRGICKEVRNCSCFVIANGIFQADNHCVCFRSCRYRNCTLNLCWRTQVAVITVTSRIKQQGIAVTLGAPQENLRLLFRRFFENIKMVSTAGTV